MKRWLRKFENAMAAVAFAEEGEFETARESLKEERTILLALRGGEADRNAFRYALNICKRIGADMEILYVSEIAAGLLKKFRSQLKKEGIGCGIIQKNGSLEQEIRNYTDAKGDILFVVVEVSEGIDIHNKKADKIMASTWENLKCPLVVVSGGDSAFAT